MSVVVEVVPTRAKSMRKLRVPASMTVDDAIEAIVGAFTDDTGHLYDLTLPNGTVVKSTLGSFGEPLQDKPGKIWGSRLLGRLGLSVGDHLSLTYDYGSTSYFTIKVQEISSEPPANTNRAEVLDSRSNNPKYAKAVAKRKAAPKPKNIDGIYIMGGFGSGKDPMIADVAKILPGTDKSWKKLSPLPEWDEYDNFGDKVTGNDNHTAAVYDNKIYTFGGRQTFRIDCYDIHNDSWTTDAIPNPSDWVQEWHLRAEVIGDKMYVVGGYNWANRQPELWAYNFTEKKWTLLATPSTRLEKFDTAVVGNKIYVIGGQIGHAVRNTVEVYDTETNTWSEAAPLLTARFSHCASSLGGYIYVTGGRGAVRDDLTSAERYNVATNTWETIPSPSRGTRVSHMSVAWKGNLYIMAGVGPTSSKLQTECEVYNPKTNTWEVAFKVRKSLGAAAVIVDTSNASSSSSSSNNNNREDGNPSPAKKAKISA